jgi:hypothetical protein
MIDILLAHITGQVFFAGNRVVYEITTMNTTEAERL